MPGWSQQGTAICDGNTAETTACLVGQYQKSDADLNAVYREAIESATTYGPNDLANLRAAQRRWIAYRDAACEAEFSLYHGGTGGGPAKFACLGRITDQRIQELKLAYL